MAPPGRDLNAITALEQTFPAMLPSFESYPSDKWPSQWLATLGSKIRIKDGQICTVIKSPPQQFVAAVVPDGDEGQQLLQWAQQQEDLDIHLQVRTVGGSILVADTSCSLHSDTVCQQLHRAWRHFIWNVRTPLRSSCISTIYGPGCFTGTAGGIEHQAQKGARIENLAARLMAWWCDM